MRGTDNQLWRKGYNGVSWGQWQPYGGQWTSDLGAVCDGAGRVVVTGRGTDNQLWEISIAAT